MFNPNKSEWILFCNIPQIPERQGEEKERTVTASNGLVTIPLTPIAGKKKLQKRGMKTERCLFPKKAKLNPNKSEWILFCIIPQIPERQGEVKGTDSHSIQWFDNHSPNSKSWKKEVTEKRGENRAVPIPKESKV